MTLSSDYDAWINDPDEDAAWGYLSDEALNNTEESMSAEVTVTITFKGTKLELTLAEVRQLRRVLNELAGGESDSIRIRGGEMPTWPKSPGWGITNGEISDNKITFTPRNGSDRLSRVIVSPIGKA